MSPDYKNLPPELVKKLKDWESKRPENQQLKVLADIANMTQELVSVADETSKSTSDTSKQLSALGAVLDDSRQQLMQLNKKEVPESPDYAKPVVNALDRVIAEIKKQQIKPVFNPEIKVNTPKIELPNIDLKGIERLLKVEIPKAFNDSIKLIPQTIIPEKDDAELQLLLQELIAVTTEVRDKRIPIPSAPKQMVVTNTNGTPVGNSFGISGYDYFSYTSGSTTDTYTFKSGGSGGTTVSTVVLTYTNSTKATLSSGVRT